MLTTNTYTCITGASSGIGRAAAKKFAEQGHNLIIIARRKQLLEELAHELMHQFPAIDVVIKTTDLSLPEHALALYNELHDYHITTWINNAGFGNYAFCGRARPNKNFLNYSTLILKRYTLLILVL